MTDTSILQSVQQMRIKRIVAEYEMQKYNLKVNAVCCFSDSVITYIYMKIKKRKINIASFYYMMYRFSLLDGSIIFERVGQALNDNS